VNYYSRTIFVALGVELPTRMSTLCGILGIYIIDTLASFWWLKLETTLLEKARESNTTILARSRLVAGLGELNRANAHIQT
jgi:hypothetical protein